MDKTNYTLLSIVAIVAITAVVSIFLHARAGDGLMPVAEGASATGNVVRSGITGNVVVQEQQVQTGNKLDLNGDNRLTSEDAELLGEVIDRLQFCPKHKYCDLDSSGVIDINDLALLNRYILEDHIASAPVQAPTETVVRTERKDDNVLMMGAFGAIA
jgi:hypothetical protein